MRKATLPFIALAMVTSWGAIPKVLAQSSVTSSQERTAVAVGTDCTTDKCSNTGQGCASCVELRVELPANAWVTKTHCYTTAHYPDDYPRHDMREVGCGEDVSWSVFDTPTVSSTSSNVVIRTTYHNRSDNRSRDVRLKVDWTGSQPSAGLVSPMPESRVVRPEVNRVSEELITDAVWSIAHEGCNVYSGNEMRGLSELRECYASTQKSTEA